jgi:PAS domain S-box-containing protein
MTSAAATILIVDDEMQNRKLLEALLRPEGYLTLSAANGEEALASIAQRAPDLILLDIMMPGMDGYQVAIILKANPATSNIPIIMVTALIDRSARLAGLNAGAEEFLTKPVDRAELWLRVRNLLRLKTFGDFLQRHSSVLEQQVRARTADLVESEARLTERKQAEIALFAEKEHLRVTLSSIGNAIITTDTSGNITYLNPVAETMTGWRNEEAAGLPLPQVFVTVNEHSNAIAPNLVESVLQHEQVTELSKDTLLIQRGGARFAIEDSAAPIRDLQGEIIGVVLVFHSVLTELHRESFIAISLDASASVLHTDWKGYQSVESIKQGCEIILELMVRHDAYRILNDNTHIFGIWWFAAEWGAADWFPRMKDAGLRAFAWVYSPTKLSQVSTDDTLSLMDPDAFNVKAFYDKEEAAAWLSAPSSDNRQSEARTMRALIVEDSADFSRLFRDMLEIMGCDVDVVSNAEAGLKAAKKNVPDIVFCDIGLPGKMDGLEFASQVRNDQDLAHVALIAVSNLTSNEDCERAMTAGFDRVFPKPVKFVDVSMALAAFAKARK